MSKHIVPLMCKNGSGGAIVNIASISARIAQAKFAPYAMSKAAVKQLTRNSAVDLGKYNIRYWLTCFPDFILRFHSVEMKAKDNRAWHNTADLANSYHVISPKDAYRPFKVESVARAIDKLFAGSTL